MHRRLTVSRSVLDLRIPWKEDGKRTQVSQMELLGFKCCFALEHVDLRA